MRLDPGNRNTGYCKSWCVPWDASHPDNHGCQAADSAGVPIPYAKNSKKDKHGVHRKYCKKVCRPELCGAAGGVVSGPEEAYGTGEASGDEGNDDEKSRDASGNSNEQTCKLACVIDPPTNLKALGALKGYTHGKVQ